MVKEDRKIKKLHKRIYVRKTLKKRVDFPLFITKTSK